MIWSETIDSIGSGWLVILAVLFVGVLYWAFRSNRHR
ncbi:MAG: CcoQ/FixQ family Cbb3-type cytochrome c oxidase assembly chaperone [Rhodospirillales bacterium]|nr:CcoQ/FixQ family Cbb3-type cytochrome c oxidase assembly chaperone [Rhodospirillales bacterium]